MLGNLLIGTPFFEQTDTDTHIVAAYVGLGPVSGASYRRRGRDGWGR